MVGEASLKSHAWSEVYVAGLDLCEVLPWLGVMFGFPVAWTWGYTRGWGACACRGLGTGGQVPAMGVETRIIRASLSMSMSWWVRSLLGARCCDLVIMSCSRPTGWATVRNDREHVQDWSLFLNCCSSGCTDRGVLKVCHFSKQASTCSPWCWDKVRFEACPWWHAWWPLYCWRS